MVVFNPKAYCRRKGTILSDIMVACESGEDVCPNGGWLHPQCTGGLREFTAEQIDAIETWFCQDCVAAGRAPNTGPVLSQSPRKSSTTSHKLMVRLSQGGSPGPKMSQPIMS